MSGVYQYGTNYELELNDNPNSIMDFVTQFIGELKTVFCSQQNNTNDNVHAQVRSHSQPYPDNQPEPGNCRCAFPDVLLPDIVSCHTPTFSSGSTHPSGVCRVNNVSFQDETRNCRPHRKVFQDRIYSSDVTRDEDISYTWKLNVVDKYTDNVQELGKSPESLLLEYAFFGQRLRCVGDNFHHQKITQARVHLIRKFAEEIEVVVWTGIFYFNQFTHVNFSS